MPSMLVTCPDTSQLELIDFEDDDLGMLITACTAFKPACELGCARTCAARIDQHRRQRAEGEYVEYTLVPLRR
ncbi:MAG TPA: hypothetical protein VM513_01915 [Kofleriaceae bacterium]|nr:hypothetical protein [Kofleriaceae bacterium]